MSEPPKRGRGRPKGSKSKPGSKKPGPKPKKKYGKPVKKKPGPKPKKKQLATVDSPVTNPGVLELLESETETAPTVPVVPLPPRKQWKRSTDSSAKMIRSGAQHHDEQNMSFKDLCRVPEYTSFKPLDLKSINWERRLACKADPLLDLKTYMPNVFYLGWSDPIRELVHLTEEKIRYGGKKSFGMPRGGGKTAVCRGMIHRAIKYGLRNFCFFIGSKDPKAKQTLKFIKGLFHRSAELQQDFPEICYPVYRIEGRSSIGMHGQTYKGERTYLNWSADEVQFATMLFDEEDVAGYLEHDPSCVIWLPDRGVPVEKYIINSSGSIIRTAGIDGSIRGEADIHPILLTQPRPDLVLLDDVQKDQKADSLKACDDLERLIESAIDYLAAPDVTQAAMMPCTVIRDGDVSDLYLSQEKPEWGGLRRGLIDEYPEGLDDDKILDEVNGVPNRSGQLWLEYKEIRDRSYREHGNLKLANAFYNEHQKEMDAGFKVSWVDRYKQDSEDPNVNELSAIQSAMNWRFKDHLSFLSEGQNKPRSKVDTEGLLLRVEDILGQVTDIGQNEMSSQWTNIVCFVDVQDELLFYGLFAHDHAYNGQFIDYGCFPNVKSNFFRKSQLAGWSRLTREFFKAYPNERPGRSGGRLRAPFDAKIYLALKQCCTWLLSRTFPVPGSDQLKSIRALAIDTQWGKASDVTKRFVREFNDSRVICYVGQPYLPSHLQIEEYADRDGWLYEHQQFPHVRESKWIIKTLPNGSQILHADVNRLKSFLMKRMSTPIGSQGAVTLFRPQHQDQHKMFASHVAESEYPEAISARGMTKDCWQKRPHNANDNDYLDIAAGCMCLAAVCGASIKSGEEVTVVPRKKLRDLYAEKRRR